jgi:uncharacterized membrane protein
MISLRLFYLATVLVALFVNIGEYQHAKWVCQELLRRNLNGIRQMIAVVNRSEELTRVWIQILLLVIAIISLTLPQNVLIEVREGATPEQIKEAFIYRRMVAVSILCHILVAVLLAVKSWKHRQARHDILELSHGGQL